MNKSILFILFLLISAIAFSQKVVVGLQNINTIYEGIKNPIIISMNGYTLDKLKTTTEGCTLIIDTLINQYYLTANKEGICKVRLTFKKANKIKLDSLIFKIKKLPKPESLFGELESGSYSIQELIDQNLLNAIIPNFYIDGYEYTVTNYSTIYVPKRGESDFFKSNKNQIPLDLKFRIMASKKGDKVLIDDITAERTDGKKRRLAPIVMTITNDYEELNSIDYDFRNVEPINDTTIKNNFNNDPWNLNKSGITKGYLKVEKDSQLVFEVKKVRNKILWEKHFYPSGKLQAEYNFEANDTLGAAISYYENGKLKSRGKILPKFKNIYNYYRIDIKYGHCYMDYDHMHFMDSFLLINYVPYGHWLCYSENGKLLMDCNLTLFNHGKMPMSKNDSAFDISNHNPNWEKATINTTLINSSCYLQRN